MRSKHTLTNKTLLQLLALVFFASGFSSLIYQVAWQRILTIYYSVENISTTLIVSVYMLGLGLGAITGGYITERIKQRLGLYCVIELLIGLFGCISIPLLELIGRNTTGSNYMISFIGMFAFLCIPTFLMGITLPLLTKIYNSSSHNFFNSVSYLYFVNTLGAALGCLFTSYILISFLGLDSSIYVAALINVIIAALVFAFRRKAANETTENDSSITITKSNAFSSPNLVFFLVFITGFIAVGYEIIWFRVIGTIVKASPYAFSSILFIYLMGIAFGSLFMKKYLHRHPDTNRKEMFFKIQFYIAAFVLVSTTAYYYLISYVSFFSDLNSASFTTMEHPNPVVPRRDSAAHFFKDLFVITDVFIWPFLFIFIPTLLMGASFPLITSLAFKNKNTASTVGKVYFFNVLGNVTGGLITCLILFKVLGTEYSILVLSITGLSFIFLARRQALLSNLKRRLGVTFAIVILAIFFFPSSHKLYLAIHPKVEYHPDEKKIINEGLDGVIMTYSYGEKLSTYINGMSHGGRIYPTFYYEAIEALSFKKDCKSVLVIGFGTGSTVETILRVTPDAKIKLVELSPTLIENLTQVNYLRSFLEHKNVDIEYADGRKFLYNSKEKYDAVFIDPLRTTTAFSNNLYSKEFFGLIKEHLKPDGVLMVWTDEYHVVPKTLCTVFPFVNQYIYFCVSGNQELRGDSTFKYKAFSLFPTFETELLQLDKQTPLNRSSILATTVNYPINEDYKPFCEYYIGLKLSKGRFQ